MQKYSRDIVAQVLAANDIADIIGAALELKPAGPGRLKALCPFHHEKTPSFTVNRQRQIFHCFGCGKGGDALGFLIEHEGLSFGEALRRLADRAGIRLPALTQRDEQAEQARTHLLEFNKFAGRHFRELLEHPMRGSTARQYLKSRQLKDETIRRFGLGFAPEGWTNLLDSARSQGFQANIIEASGLFKRGDSGRLYDFFRNRLMFPIEDVSGNVVAFGGRAMDDSPAKYVNSPETSVYKKSRVLYGLSKARDALRREDFAILVEGYIDLMRCFDAGIENVVATCGTALTTEQASLIRRYVPEVVLVYDGDTAGINAAIKATGILSAAGLTVRAMALPDNQDPDDFIRREGPEAFRALVREASDFVTFYIRMSHARTQTIEGRSTVAQELFAILQGLDDELRIDQYVKRIARELGLTEWACQSEFNAFRRRSVRRPAVKAQEKPAQKALSRDDCDFITVLLSNEDLLDRVREALRGVTLGTGALEQVLARLFEGRSGVLLQDFEEEDARRLYAEAANGDPAIIKDPEKLVAKQTDRLEKDGLRTRVDALSAAIRAAQQSKNHESVMELVAQKAALDKQAKRWGAV